MQTLISSKCKMLLFRTSLYVLLLCPSSASVMVSLPPNNSSPNPYLTTTKIFLQNYQKMVQNFKIFMYEPNTAQFRFETELESLFYSSLQNSPYITKNPEEAHFFFFPFISPNSMRSLAPLISRIRNDFPYWNRTLGADHFYLSCTGIPLEDVRNTVELKKNAVQISCFPTRRDYFVPHKDLTLPPLLDPHAPVRFAGGEFCFVNYNNDDVLWVGEALRFGCVPVVVTGGPVNDIPFMDVLRWKEMAVFVKNGVKNDNNTWRVRHEYMRRLGVVASKHFQWNRTPKPFDAFNTIMYQLWLKRHTVRYECI